MTDKIENWQDYIRATRRTAGDDRPEILAMGLFGEAGEVVDLIKKIEGHGHELDRDRMISEVGDVLWYAARCFDTVIAENADVPLAPCGYANRERLMEYLGELVEGAGAYAAELFGNRCTKPDSPVYLSSTLYALAMVCECYDLPPLLDIARANIAKLRERYPEGFSTERSVNRDQ
jgi:hypothetical protein